MSQQIKTHLTRELYKLYTENPYTLISYDGIQRQHKSLEIIMNYPIINKIGDFENHRIIRQYML